MKELFTLIIVGFLTRGSLTLDYVTEKPDYLSSCSTQDTNFVQCITNTMQQLFDQMKNGIPGLKTLQRSDPYHIKKVKLSQNNNAATLTVELKDIDVRGLGSAVIKENIVDQKDYSWATKAFFHKLRIDGDYRVDGRLLLLTLKGQGKLFIEMRNELLQMEVFLLTHLFVENVDMKLNTKVKLYEKGGFTFGNVTEVKMDFKIGGLKTRLDNLFNGNVELEESINTLINENWMEFLEALRPAIKQTVETILKDNLEKIFHFIPAIYFISDIPTSDQLYG